MRHTFNGAVDDNHIFKADWQRDWSNERLKEAFVLCPDGRWSPVFIMARVWSTRVVTSAGGEAKSGHARECEVCDWRAIWFCAQQLIGDYTRIWVRGLKKNICSGRSGWVRGGMSYQWWWWVRSQTDEEVSGGARGSHGVIRQLSAGTRWYTLMPRESTNGEARKHVSVVARRSDSHCMRW